MFYNNPLSCILNIVIFNIERFLSYQENKLIRFYVLKLFLNGSDNVLWQDVNISNIWITCEYWLAEGTKNLCPTWHNYFEIEKIWLKVRPE